MSILNNHCLISDQHLLNFYGHLLNNSVWKWTICFTIWCCIPNIDLPDKCNVSLVNLIISTLLWALFDWCMWTSGEQSVKQFYFIVSILWVTCSLVCLPTNINLVVWLISSSLWVVFCKRNVSIGRTFTNQTALFRAFGEWLLVLVGYFVWALRKHCERYCVC